MRASVKHSTRSVLSTRGTMRYGSTRRFFQTCFNSMRVLQIGADRSRRGILFLGTPGAKRQEAYAQAFGELYVVGFSRRSDGATHYEFEGLRVFPTNSISRPFYILDALRIARELPKPDVVSAQDPFETGLVAWLLARHCKVPLHVQVHTDFLAPEYARHSFVNHVRVLLARFILARADGIRVVSERIKVSLRAAGYPLPTISVLPIFVDTAQFRYAQEDAAR